MLAVFVSATFSNRPTPPETTRLTGLFDVQFQYLRKKTKDVFRECVIWALLDGKFPVIEIGGTTPLSSTNNSSLGYEWEVLLCHMI